VSSPKCFPNIDFRQQSDTYRIECGFQHEEQVTARKPGHELDMSLLAALIQ
jgi:hypothetical protein